MELRVRLASQLGGILAKVMSLTACYMLGYTGVHIFFAD